MEKYVPGIGISAGLLMVKWALLDQRLAETRIDIKPGDKLYVASENRIKIW